MDISRLVSVIIPVYNVEQYVAKCIESVLCQTYTQLEIITVDDGSTDESGAICETYAKTDNRITVYHKENGGLSDARNYGLDHCHGQYIVFVDSDDYIAVNLIERMLQAVETEHADLAVCNFWWIEESGEIVEKTSLKEMVLEHDKVMDQFVFEGQYWYSVAWNKMYTSKIFANLRFPKGKIHEDEYIAHYVYDLCEKVVFIQDNLYYYVKRQDSIVNRKVTERGFDVTDAFFDRYCYYKEKKYSRYYSKAAWQVWNSIENLIEQIGWKHIGDERKIKIRRIYSDVYKDLVKGMSKTGLEFRRCFAFRFAYGLYRLERKLE